MRNRSNESGAGMMTSRRMTRRRFASGAAGAVAAAAGVTRLSRASAAVLRQSKITVPFFTTENDPDTLKFYNDTIKGFQQQQPDVDVKITLYQDENQLQYITTAFQTGTDLGIFAPPSGFITAWAQQAKLMPLTQLIDHIGASDFLPGTRLVVDGKDYAMPFQSNASALWVRTDILDKAGLKPPTTYDEYLSAAKEFHGKNGLIGVSSAVGAVPGLTEQYFTPYIHQAGWDYFDKTGKLTFDQPAVLDAVKRFADLMKYTSPGMYNGTYQDILSAYISGRAVFGTFPGRIGVNLAKQNPKIADVTTVVPVPAGPFMTGKLLFGGIQHYVVYAKTAHPQETMAFLEYMTTGQRSLEFAMTVPGHLLPPLQSVRKLVSTYKSPFMSKHGNWVIALNDMVPDAFSPDLSMGSVADNKYLGRLSNPCPWASQLWGSPPMDGSMFQEILIKGTDPETAWKNTAAKMGDAAASWKKANPDWKSAA